MLSRSPAHRWSTRARRRWGVAVLVAGTLVLDPSSWARAVEEKPQEQPAKSSKSSSSQPQSGTTKAEPAAPKLDPDRLDALVAPIALYPDELLAQTLVAATYPLELVQMQQWLAKNKDKKDKALADAVAKQPWDPAVKSMAATPEVVKRLTEDIQWTTELGDAFLAQQKDVMAAIQRMRKKAIDQGTLQSNEQQKVETKTVENKTVIYVQPSSPEVVYVPAYDPYVAYGPAIYPYPHLYYPPYTVGAAAVSFGIGVTIGAAFWGGSCCGMGWGDNDVYINNSNNFIRSENRNVVNNRGGRSSWQHNPRHRGNVPYSDRATADRFGGSLQGERGGERFGERGDTARAGERGDAARDAAGERRGEGAAGERGDAAREGAGERAGERSGDTARGAGERSGDGPKIGGGDRRDAGRSGGRGGGGFGGGRRGGGGRRR